MLQFLRYPTLIVVDPTTLQRVSGAKIYTYDVGTTNNRATYPTIADAKAKTNANANPVVADSNGEADVVLAGPTRIVIKDSTDTTTYIDQDIVDGESDILDDNGNELLVFSTTASAVNHLQITNAATGNDVVIEPVGDDTNIGLTIQPKNSGSITINSLSIQTPFSVGATNSSAAEIRLPEDTDNGSNYMSIKSPATITTSTTLVLPDGDASTSDSAMVSDTSGNLSWKYVAEAATQATIETGTDTTDFITAGRQQYHKSAAKVWIHISTSGGVPTNEESYNVTSISDDAVGKVTIIHDVDFSTSTYCVSNSSAGSASDQLIIRVESFSTTSTQIGMRASGEDASYSLQDPITSYGVVMFGDQ